MKGGKGGRQAEGRGKVEVKGGGKGGRRQKAKDR